MDFWQTLIIATIPGILSLLGVIITLICNNKKNNNDIQNTIKKTIKKEIEKDEETNRKIQELQKIRQDFGIWANTFATMIPDENNKIEYNEIEKIHKIFYDYKQETDPLTKKRADGSVDDAWISILTSADKRFNLFEHKQNDFQDWMREVRDYKNKDKMDE